MIRFLGMGILVLTLGGLMNCSSLPKELEPDDLLEQELRADPEKFRDSGSRDIKEKEEPKKVPKKR
jgi:hypothetical protein